MLEEKIGDHKINEIISFLSGMDLFKKIKEDRLRELVKSMTLIFLEGGETFIREGDYDPTLYILMQGRLRVFINTESNESGVPSLTPIGEVSVGEIVGEIALLANLPRTSTVRSIRHSILIKLSEENFQEFKKIYPAEVNEIAIIAIKRLTAKKRQTEAGERIRTIAVAPAGNSDHRSFAHQFVNELNKIESAILVNLELCNQNFGKDIAQVKLEGSENVLINSWLNSLENQYSYVVYETDFEMTSWTQRCLRQADRVIFVAEDHKDSHRNSIEEYLFSLSSENLLYNEVVFTHADAEIKGTSKWLKDRSTNGYHHLRLSSQADWDKLIRFLRGRALGVVLSGGAARAYVHIGIIKAMEELNIPIDFIAGNSMGGAVASAYAFCGVSGSIDFAHNFANYSPDYTFPYISLLSGKHISHVMKYWFGDTEIEDLKIRFFCTSTNLTKESLHIHDRGVLWKAVRTGVSLPSFFPPVYDENDNMLVDGGVINNLPVDVMRKLMSGGKILAINCNAFKSQEKNEPLKETWASGWKLLFNRFNFFRKNKKEYDDIFNIIFLSMNLASNEHERRMEKLADYVILCDSKKFEFWDFKNVGKLVEEGYKVGMEMLPKLFSTDL